MSFSFFIFLFSSFRIFFKNFVIFFHFFYFFYFFFYNFLSLFIFLLGVLRSVFGSKFEARKTPLSHGFRGFSAIKKVADGT